LATRQIGAARLEVIVADIICCFPDGSARRHMQPMAGWGNPCAD